MPYDYSLPFDWKRHFVPDRAVDCLPACVSMAARYWAELRPDLKIPIDLEAWKKFVAEQKGMTMRGSSITRLMDNLNKTLVTAPSDTLHLTPTTLSNVESTIQFLSRNPPIPLVLIFDRSYMITNHEGGYHACLLYGVDYKKEKKVALIDPNVVDSTEAFPWDMKVFSRGWDKVRNLAFVVHPPDIKIVKSKKGFKGKPLTTYMKEYE